MSVSVGVREFRHDLAGFIDQAEPVTVTRHGQMVGLFIPIGRDRTAAVAAYAEAARKARSLLVELGLTEDEAVGEFAAARQANSTMVAA